MRFHEQLTRTVSLAVLSTMLFSMASPAAAQRGRDRDELWDGLRPVAPTPLEETRGLEAAQADSPDRLSAGLLREGALLLEVPATVLFDDETDTWYALMHLDSRGQRAVEPREMRVLPNSFLSELEQVVEATPNQRITFELTGETLVHDGRNYLLLRAPARVVGLERIESAQGAAPARPSDRPVDSPQPRQRRGASEVMRELERDSGPLHRTPIVPRPPAAADADGVPAANGRAPDAHAPSRTMTNERRQWREGTLIVQRRGRLTRDPGGSWRFVFDADAQGLSDPPLTLMPCLLLERIERFARQAGPTAAVLINGEVFVHDGRAYLLPSAFQLPRERTPLN